MQEIKRLGESRRWADVVIYRGVAQWVEVAEDLQQDTLGQVRQVLAQINTTLAQLGSRPTDLLQVLIYLADLSDVAELNAAWDAWVPEGHAPVRACVAAGLGANCRVEMIITAAVPEKPS